MVRIAVFFEVEEVGKRNVRRSQARVWPRVLEVTRRQCRRKEAKVVAVVTVRQYPRIDLKKMCASMLLIYLRDDDIGYQDDVGKTRNLSEVKLMTRLK